MKNILIGGKNLDRWMDFLINFFSNEKRAHPCTHMHTNTLAYTCAHTNTHMQTLSLSLTHTLKLVLAFKSINLEL